MLDHLPERDRSAIERRLRAAWEAHDHRTAIERLQTLAGELARSQPRRGGLAQGGPHRDRYLHRLGVH
ncbi:MAG: hypothetical protein M3N47_05355 [Chloroflexota bacterium]|nr:hypothetical protein [Chloroflexota bacterium]